VLAVTLVVVLALNLILSPFYLSVGNIANLFELSIEKVMVVVVMTFVIISGEIDLSVASMMGFGAAVIAVLNAAGMPLGLAIAIALAAGAAFGLLQGWFVARLGLPSLAVTIAGLIGIRGGASILIEDRSVGGFPEWFTNLGQDPILGPLPLSVVLFAVGIVVAGIVLHRTAFGRSVFVIGNNAAVAQFSGIDVARTKLVIFAMSGLVAALAGIFLAARVGSVRGSLAQGFELDIVTMVLLGGVSIFGGRGRLVGVALSILIVLNLRNGLGLANVGSNLQTGIIGALLILSVLIPNLVSTFQQRRRSAALA
jgi:rhamnose transport system permease protein